MTFDEHVVKVVYGSTEWTTSGQAIGFDSDSDLTYTFEVTLQDGYVLNTVTSSTGAVISVGPNSFVIAPSPGAGDAITITTTEGAVLPKGTYKWVDVAESLKELILGIQSIEFTSNGTEFTSLEVDNVTGNISYDTTEVYTAGLADGTWTNEAYKTIVLATDQIVTTSFYNLVYGQYLIPVTSESETWVLNSPTETAMPDTTINFVSNGLSFTGMSQGTGSASSEYYFIGDDLASNKTVAGYSPFGWEWAEEYRTITFATSPTGDLLTWLQANGTKQSASTTKSYDLSTSSKWNSLSVGSHSVYVVACADGYSDSDASVAVVVNKPVSLISFTIAGATYEAEEGMTWGEWISSSYNTTNWEWDGTQNINIGAPSSRGIFLNGNAVQGLTVIVAGGTYILKDTGPL